MCTTVLKTFCSKQVPACQAPICAKTKTNFPEMRTVNGSTTVLLCLLIKQQIRSVFFFYFASLYTVQDTEVTVSYAHRKGIWESGGGAPHILHLGTRWGAFPNYPLEPTVLRRYTKCRSHLKILSILHVISIPTVENYKMHDTKITSTGITLTHI